MPKGALTSFTICDAYRYFVGQAKLLTSKSRSRGEYLITTDNIIVLYHFFSLAKNLILLAVCNRFNKFFDKLIEAWLTFLGHPVDGGHHAHTRSCRKLGLLHRKRDATNDNRVL